MFGANAEKNESLEKKVADLNAKCNAFEWKEIQVQRAHLFAELHDALLFTFIGQGICYRPELYLKVSGLAISSSGRLKLELKNELNAATRKLGHQLFQDLDTAELMLDIELMLLIQIKRQIHFESHCSISIKTYRLDKNKEEIVNQIRNLIDK